LKFLALPDSGRVFFVLNFEKLLKNSLDGGIIKIGDNNMNEIKLDKLRKRIEELQNGRIINSNIGIAAFPVSVEIQSINSHAEKRLKERGITKEDAQSYINNAMIMFEQKEKIRLYISNDGNSAVLIRGTELITAYPAKDFDNTIKIIIEEVKKYE